MKFKTTLNYSPQITSGAPQFHLPKSLAPPESFLCSKISNFFNLTNQINSDNVFYATVILLLDGDSLNMRLLFFGPPFVNWFCQKFNLKCGHDSVVCENQSHLGFNYTEWVTNVLPVVENNSHYGKISEDFARLLYSLSNQIFVDKLKIYGYPAS